ncbi:MAG: hypothetical protein GTO40_26725 [Deltaproteobacteria bacterium]|nr:hypothetical protein [Deltaproteobacteria bacterium]
MTRLARFRLANVLAYTIVCFVLASFQAPLLALIVEQVVVVVDGDPYTSSDLDQYAKRKTGQKLPTNDFEKLSQDANSLVILEQFITDKLISAEVKRLGIVIGDAQIDAFIASIKQKHGISNEQLAAVLRRDGMDMTRYRESIRSEMEREKLVRWEVKDKINVTPEDVKRYYDANKKKFRTKDRVRLRHILFQMPDNPTPLEKKSVTSKALEVRQLALSGESFAELARKYSQGAGASEGGEIGWMDRSSLIPELANAAFNMSAGQISQPISTSLGIHLIKVEERDRGTVKPLSAVEEQIKKELNAKVSEEKFTKWLKTDLRKNHQVDVKVPGVVFRAEESKEDTVNALMASASKNTEERSLMSKLNPFSYIFKSTPAEDEDGEFTSDEKTVTVFGKPIFRTESATGSDDDFDILSEPSTQGQGTAEPQGSSDAQAAAVPEEENESKGFFSKVLDGINPF